MKSDTSSASLIAERDVFEMHYRLNHLQAQIGLTDRI